MSLDPTVVVIPIRSLTEITADLESARAAKELAINRNTQAIERLNQITRSIEEREAAVEGISGRKEDAKDSNRDSEAATLKIEEKANKKAIDLLKRVRDLREAEIEVTKVEQAQADIAILVFEKERELQGKRSERGWQWQGNSSDLTRNTAHQVIGELEANLLELQEDLAGSTQKVASKQKEVVKKRRELHKAQLKLGM